MGLNEGIRKYKDIEKAARKLASEARKKKEPLNSASLSKGTKTQPKTAALSVGQSQIPQKGQAQNQVESKSGDGASTEASAAQDEQEQLQKEIEEDLARESKVTDQLVKEDYSPLNSTRDKLVVEYAPLIKYVAQKIAVRLPANIELDDLISSGVIGLMDAMDKYDATRDNKFKTYAEFRIRGAILDELRAQDWVPRSVREKAKMLERCYAKIEQQKGRQAVDEEVCQELGITQAEYHELLNQIRSVSLLSFDDLSHFSRADKRTLHGAGENGVRVPTPFSEVNVASVKRIISDAIQDLPEKQRLVLSLYYYEDLNLKEIGRVLNVTESRVSQLHTQAVLRLKARLKNHWDDFITLLG